MNINLPAGVAGYIKIEATNEKTGERRVVADWFKNLITDAGMNRLGVLNPNCTQYCLVGSGSNTPAVSDTSLGTFVAVHSTTNASSNGTAASAPYYRWFRQTYRFNAGVATGNLTEVGFGWSNSNTNIFSRSLIKDGNGNPTTVTVLADEFLDITYEFRVYQSTTDFVTVKTIEGVDTTITMRPCQITDNYYSHSPSQLLFYGIRNTDNGAYGGRVYSGAIADVTLAPSGTTASANATMTSDAYANNSFTMTGTHTIGLNYGNMAFSAYQFAISGFGYYQVGFSVPVQKTSSKTFTLSVSFTWSRA